ncbi:MAG: hypothetical protein IJO48_07250 [Clostridia bacterium]|nr:hypothetical protein [Clostridia bacterium]
MKKILAFVLCAIMMMGVFMTPEVSKAATVDSRAGVISVSSGKLNVRSGSSTGSTVVASLGKGGYVTLISNIL